MSTNVVNINQKESRAFYSTPRWIKLRKRVMRKWLSAKKACPYCGEPIDRRQRLIVDHIYNRKQFPDMAYREDNLQVVHHACNTQKYYKHEQRIEDKPQRDVEPVGDDGFPIDSEWS